MARALTTRRIWDEMQARDSEDFQKSGTEATSPTLVGFGGGGVCLKVYSGYELADRLVEASEDMRLRCVERQRQTEETDGFRDRV